MAGPVVILSNRGPVSHEYDADGNVVARRGAGGVVSSLGPMVRGTGATWMAAPMTDADRDVAVHGALEAEDFRVRYVSVPPDVYRMAYDVISNGTLWFLHHSLFDLARRPRIDDRWWAAWDAYRSYNRAFARAVIDDAPEEATVLVQDYHLALVGTWLAQERSDLRAIHFTHIPFCPPDALRVLPSQVAEELLIGMASHRSCGFHARRWSQAFESCCDDVLGFTPATFVAPLAPDHDDIYSVAASPECAEEQAKLEEALGDRHMILRVDRIELSKNLLRGFFAYDAFLRTHPEWHGRVVFAALIYPSREALPEYLAYRAEVEGLARQINERWATPSWTPVLVDTSDNFPRSVAALRRYDVLLVNPVRDGLNLVAKEGPMLNEHDGVLALSREAGAWEELGSTALEINPFDVRGTAETLATALSMDATARAEHAAALRAAVAKRTPRDWLDDQLNAAGD